MMGQALKARFNTTVQRQSHTDWCRNESLFQRWPFGIRNPRRGKLLMNAAPLAQNRSKATVVAGLTRTLASRLTPSFGYLVVAQFGGTSRKAAFSFRAWRPCVPRIAQRFNAGKVAPKKGIESLVCPICSFCRFVKA